MKNVISATVGKFAFALISDTSKNWPEPAYTIIEIITAQIQLYPALYSIIPNADPKKR